MSASRVVRGGGWYHDASYARVADRFSYVPSLRNDYLGFRLVEEPVDEVDVEDTYRVIRGGGWNHDASSARVALRDGLVPSYRFVNLGFRLVKEQGGE